MIMISSVYQWGDIRGECSNPHPTESYLLPSKLYSLKVKINL